MATSVEAALIDALVSQCVTALPNITVFDAFGPTPGVSDNTGNTGDFLMVGVDDPDADGWVTSASTQETPGPFGTNRPRDEAGEVWLTAESWNGNKDQQAARSGVEAIVASVADLCRANPSLGVPNLLWTGYGSGGDLKQNQTKDAAGARKTFRISFRARI